MKSLVMHAFSLLLINQTVTAQLRLEQVPLSPVKSNTGFFVYGANNLSRQLPYSSINGSPYWNDEFRNATLYLSDGRVFGPCPVKLNLATNEVNFLNETGDKFTAQPGIIQKIIFYRNDTSQRELAMFSNNIDLINTQPKYKDIFIEELNQGKIQLLKISQRVLKMSDSLFGTIKKYFFSLQENYFIRQKNKIYSLKRLSRKEIHPLLYLTNEEQTWEAENKINFSKEQDLIAFFNYLSKTRN